MFFSAEKSINSERFNDEKTCYDFEWNIAKIKCEVTELMHEIILMPVSTIFALICSIAKFVLKLNLNLMCWLVFTNITSWTFR